MNNRKTDAPIIPFPVPRRTYQAKVSAVTTDEGFRFVVAGTLEGWIDFAIADVAGSRTYPLTCDDARRIIAVLHATIEDVQARCLFGDDALLAPQVHP